MVAVEGSPRLLHPQEGLLLLDPFKEDHEGVAAVAIHRGAIADGVEKRPCEGPNGLVSGGTSADGI